MQRSIDVLFPPSESLKIVRELTPAVIERLFEPTYVTCGIALLPYSDARVRALIQEAKFHGSTKAFSLLASTLLRHLNSLPTDRKLLLIPIPLSHARERSRGYNQVREILKAAAPLLPPHMHIAPHILKRIRDTQPQTDLTRSARLQNVVDAFLVNAPQLVHGAHIILVDDVSTTGATMRAASDALKREQPASITCIALAH